MQRPLHRTDGSADSGAHIRLCGENYPGGKGRSIHPVLHTEDQISAQRLDMGFLRNITGKHIQIISGMSQLGIRFNNRQVVQLAVSISNDGRQHGRQPYSLRQRRRPCRIPAAPQCSYSALQYKHQRKRRWQQIKNAL
ncbi:hypothetical protein D3C73_1187180 [compost metagenome]